MITTLVILALSALFFVNGKIRSDLVALCALVLLMICKILTPEEALSGFSNPIVIMMVGLFVVGGAIFKTGLAKMISSKILQLAGKSELKLFILIMVVTAFIGAFVSNTGTVALMLPIVVSMAMNANINPSRFLMPLAFASSMGGMATLIGTPPNLVVQEALKNAGFDNLSFFSFTPVGLVCVLTGIIILIPLSKIFLAKKDDNNKKETSGGRTPKELAQKYQLSDNLYRLRVTSGSLVCNKTLQKLNITQTYNLTILEIRRKSPSQGRFMKTVDQKLAGPDTELKENDILYVFGAFDKIELFARENRLSLTESRVTEFAGGPSDEKLSVQEIGIAEVLLMPDSKLINKAVKDSGFRDKYGVNILGIQRKNEYILSDIKEVKMHSGDILLIQGTWDSIARMSHKQSQWVVLGQPVEEASKVTLDYKAPVAALIMICMIAAKLKQYDAKNVVVDPVMVATSGARLISEDAIETLKAELFPLAKILTPNIPETEELTGMKITSAADMEAAAKKISETYNCAVLCKGGHKLNDANDLLWSEGKGRWFAGKRIDNPNTHGTGCTLSSAIASNLAKGFDLETSVERAKDYISGALAAMLDLGKGSGPMDHGFAIDNEYTREAK